jgi:hypothetical protein
MRLLARDREENGREAIGEMGSVRERVNFDR